MKKLISLFLSIFMLVSEMAFGVQVSEPTSPEPKPNPDTSTEGEAKHPYVVTLAKFAELNKICSKKIAELSRPTQPGEPVIQVNRVLSYLERAQASALAVAEQPENTAFVNFKYADALGKVALARSALSQAVLDLGTSINGEVSSRLEELSKILQSLHDLLLSAKDPQSH